MNDARSTSRREFLAAAGALAAAPAAARALHPRRHADQRKVLVLGGTAYLGPAVVRALLDAGHEVTLFNRGKTNPDMFADVEQLRGQRRRPDFGGRGVAQDLGALKGRRWDAVVDTSGYWTANVEDMVATLRESCGHYVFISSISVYADLDKDSRTLDEDSPVGTLDDKYAAKIDEATYGPLKAYCEQAVRDGFGDRATLVRPGYIVGPHDPYDRLTSRVARLARGGDTLAPGNPNAALQMIDVRDLGAFVAKCAVDGTSGTFNATGFDGRITTEEFHHAAKLTLAHDTTFTWVSDDFLENRGIRPWGDIACWTPDQRRNYTKVERAIAAGLEFRPVTETIRDTHAWSERVAGERPLRMGIAAERERELLEQWRSSR